MRPMEVVTARLASTVLLVRDSDEGPQVFMVRRHSGNKFMANVHVFVGGALDDDDQLPEITERCQGLGDEQACQRLGLEQAAVARGLYVAAVRETFEESGVLLAQTASGADLGQDLAEALARQREQLNAGERTFAELLGELDLQLSLGRLRFLTRWITPDFEPRRYDTYFFIAKVPRDQQASFDPRETTSGQWFTPRQILEANRKEELMLAPPTLVVLEDLLDANSAEQALAVAGDQPVTPVVPRPLTRVSDGVTLLFPEDHRYENQLSKKGPEHFVVLRNQHWERVRR